VLRYTIRRLVQTIPVFFIATFLIFMIVRVLPGDPVQAQFGDRVVPEATRQAYIERYNLDEPLVTQYVLYMRDILRLDFGESIVNQRPVNDIFLEAFPRTLTLAGLAVLIEALIAIPIGVWVALRKDTWFDSSTLVVTIVMLSIPPFVLATIAQVFVGVKWGILPVAGIEQGLQSYVLPAIVIAIGLTAVNIRLMRSSLLENLREDYIRTARAKGLSERRIVGVHAIRNALIPVVTVLAIDLGALLGGTIVTESVFNIPGVGFQIVRAVSLRDNAIVVGISTILVIAYMVINLVVDLLYAVLDPRIRYE
jgi:oligopeptide transport system permease protein